MADRGLIAMESIEGLLSLPPASVRHARRWSGPLRPVFVGADPPGTQLGSGGGTAALLAEAWGASGRDSFSSWLRGSRKLIIHGSGQSRRLPAYAAEGKPLMPLPTCGALSTRSPDMRLVDLQWQLYRRLFRHAPATFRVMICCGDVLVHGRQPPPVYPVGDVLIVGLTATPEEASQHGVLFCDADAGSRRLHSFLQKPSADRIRTRASHLQAYLDSGIWLLSEAAVDLLMRRCGWDSQRQVFAEGRPGAYDLYDRFALALGTAPVEPDAEISALRAGVLAIQKSRFFHFGTNRGMLRSVARLAHSSDRGSGHLAFTHASESPVILNARCDGALPPRATGIWIENAHVGARWKLHGWHVLTGIPDNDWSLDCPEGACLDILGLQDAPGLCLRPYGFDDPFRGPLDDPGTLWMGIPVTEWFSRRGLTPAQADLGPGTDLQDAALFPCVPAPDAAGDLVQWMIAVRPPPDPELRERWLRLPRRSAAELAQRADIQGREALRMTRIAHVLQNAGPGDWNRWGGGLDFEAHARLAAQVPIDPEQTRAPSETPSLTSVHLAMFRARLAPDRHSETDAFESLRNLLVAETRLDPVRPTRNLLEDQIVWGRAPVRLDLAGGWTDTPPYCFEHGGRVVNLAVDLNGQPPIQVFARGCREPHIILHSIDLGIRECISDVAQLVRGATLGEGFGIARAALRLAGFDPRFSQDAGRGSLREQLSRDFGGGFELSMLAAVPKGSGLGTSSILAATLLGTLNELCALNWSVQDLFSRTLTLEQMLSSGGGWQDQVGGLLGGLKHIETGLGLAQKPTVRWLPEPQIREAERDGRILLYYTGITRVARNILSEIVRGIFLNDANHLAVLEDIGDNADFAADAIQKQEWNGMCEAVRRSWRLNQILDRDTHPPETQAILTPVLPWIEAAKLLGAGGGGYLLMLARDRLAGRRIRETLTRQPPNERARFVTPSLSPCGLQITRS